MQANRTTQATRGARQGEALLAGLIYCGMCQRRMMVHYKGRQRAGSSLCAGDAYLAGPRCQCVSARAVDELVAGQILQAAQPAALEASLAAVADIEQERAMLLQQWHLKIERADYEEERARRQYNACEPENRLVARTLERATVVVDKEREQVHIKLQWMGGAQTEHALARAAGRYSGQSRRSRLMSRLKELSSEGLSSSQIAAKLNAEGFRPARRAKEFNGAIVLRLLSEWGLSRGARHGSSEGLGKQEYRPGGLAKKLGVPRDTVKRWIRRGWVKVRKDERGHHIVWADAGELRRLRQLHRLSGTAANRERLAALKKPKQRPTP
jgi:hypothetical protein